LLPSVQLMEMFDDFIRLAARALVISDGVHKVFKEIKLQARVKTPEETKRKKSRWVHVIDN